MNNDDKLKKYRYQKFLRFSFLVLLLAVIVLEILALFKVIHYIWGLLIFLIAYLAKKILMKENK